MNSQYTKEELNKLKAQDKEPLELNIIDEVSYFSPETYRAMEAKILTIDIIIPTCKPLADVRPLIDALEDVTSEPHRIIATCQQVSAAKNRNYGLEIANSPIIVMIDDDMQGFFKGWLSRLVEPIQEDHKVCMVLARLKNPDGTLAPNSGDNYDTKEKWAYVERKVLPSSAIAMRDIGLRFDPLYIGSGFEDTDMCFQYHQRSHKYEFVINNECPLIHTNEMKNQKGDIWEHNEAVFLEKWNGRMSPV
jgi:glycosyltransferase involved in cell wall biosynthesis